VETFVVRLFVASDLPGFQGTVQRPGSPVITFHDAEELIHRLRQGLPSQAAREGVGETAGEAALEDSSGLVDDGRPGDRS
jgi:hypothetical protein